MTLRAMFRAALPPWRKSDGEATGSDSGDSGSFAIIGADGRPLDLNRGDAADRNTVGDGTRLSVLMAPVWWIARNGWRVRLSILDGNDQPVEAPEMVSLLPARLRFAMLADLALFGNAYAEIVRGSAGQPMKLRYLSATWVEPRPISAENLEYVRVVRPSGVIGGPIGNVRYVHAEDLVHVAWGIDPIEPATGISPLFALLQDSAMDRDAARMAAGILRTRGVTGIVMTPKGADGGSMLDEATARKWGKHIDDTYSGTTGRGKTLVTNIPMDVHGDQADLEKLAMKAIRDLSEERVCAVLGVPASVVGLGAGLTQTKVGATMREQRGIAWDNAVVPNLDLLLEVCTDKLAPEFGMVGRFGYLLPPGHVAAVDAEILARRANLLYGGGISRRGEARESVGLESAGTTDDVYIHDVKGGASAPMPAAGAAGG